MDDFLMYETAEEYYDIDEEIFSYRYKVRREVTTDDYYDDNDNIHSWSSDYDINGYED